MGNISEDISILNHIIFPYSM